MLPYRCLLLALCLVACSSAERSPTLAGAGGDAAAPDDGGEPSTSGGAVSQPGGRSGVDVVAGAGGGEPSAVLEAGAGGEPPMVSIGGAGGESEQHAAGAGGAGEASGGQGGAEPVTDGGAGGGRPEPDPVAPWLVCDTEVCAPGWLCAHDTPQTRVCTPIDDQFGHCAPEPLSDCCKDQPLGCSQSYYRCGVIDDFETGTPCRQCEIFAQRWSCGPPLP